MGIPSGFLTDCSLSFMYNLSEIMTAAGGDNPAPCRLALSSHSDYFTAAFAFISVICSSEYPKLRIISSVFSPSSGAGTLCSL